jgi:hypothetical protein
MSVPSPEHAIFQTSLPRCGFCHMGSKTHLLYFMHAAEGAEAFGIFCDA